MSRAANSLLVVVLWAAIYLSALGSLEIKGEEGRRILPAVTMIETGNYLVPQVGSEPYYRKPPLVNWLVAISFRLTGYRNEWTARLPSALSVLAVALAFLTVARASLGAKGSLTAAVIWLANFGMIEKGRLIEIEALYTSLLGLALVCWISAWHQRRAQWRIWIVPSIFLGLGLLAKGPVHLVFFYAVVLAVLHRGGELRRLASLPHVVGIAIMLGIFAAWAVPYWQVMHGANHGANLEQTWSAQIFGRFTGDDFKFEKWLLNIPRGLAYFLPWTLLLPLVSGVTFTEERDARLFRGLCWGSVVPFLLVNLLPGALPRYSMPVLPGACWMMALVLTASEIRLPTWWPIVGIASAQKRWRLVGFVAIATGIAMVLYAVAAVPMLQRRAKVRPIAAQIDGLVPEGETLYAVDPDYQPFLFYIRAHLVYVDRVDELPPAAGYLLVQPEKEREVTESQQWAPLRAKSILTVTDYRKRSVILFKVM
jgi:4-amino-4-deoxy-L-arabinose transferase-like glycosyltransferase